MKNTKKLLSVILVFCIILTLIPGNVSAMSNNIDMAKISFVEKYTGTDLLKKDFNRSKMTAKESDAFDALLDIMYLENKSFATNEGYSKEEYIMLAESLLNGSMYISDESNFRSAFHGILSTKMLGGVLNGVISATLLVTGVASVGELVKKMGKEAAKEWVESNVKKAVYNKLAAIGLGTFGIYTGNIIKGIVEAYLDPGGWLAEKIDNSDKIPNNGYIELW